MNSPIVEDWLSSEIERLRSEWNAGDYRSAAECFDLCVLNNRPIPEWVAPIIRQAMAFTAHRLNHEGGKQGRTGSYAIQWQRADIRNQRHFAATMALRMLESGELAAALRKPKANKSDAYEWAAKWLRDLGSKAVGDADRIRRDYGAEEKRRQFAGIKDKERAR